MHQRIVITGITGTIAKYLVISLVSQGKTVVALSRRAVTDSLGAEIRIGCLDDEKFLNKSLRDADVVIHAAALTRSTNSRLLKKANQDLTEAIVSAAIRNSVPRLIFLSSDLADDPVGPYGRSKLACEKLIQNSDLNDWIIFRLSPVLCTGDYVENSTIAKLIHQAKSKRLIILPGGGEFWVAPVWIEDLQTLICNAAGHGSTLRNLYDVRGAPTTLKNLISLAVDDEINIFSVPEILVNYVACILAKLSFPHPILEPLKSIGRLPKISERELYDEFGFSPTDISKILQEID